MNVVKIGILSPNLTCKKYKKWIIIRYHTYNFNPPINMSIILCMHIYSKIKCIHVYIHMFPMCTTISDIIVTWPHYDSPIKMPAFARVQELFYKKNLPLEDPRQTGTEPLPVRRFHNLFYRIMMIWSISVSVLWEIALKETLTSLSRLFLSKALSKAWPPSCATHGVMRPLGIHWFEQMTVSWWLPSEVWRLCYT